MSDEGYLLDNQGSEAGQRFDALATRSTRPPGCGLALPQSVTVMPPLVRLPERRFLRCPT
jgi:hypothetical protein